LKVGEKKRYIVQLNSDVSLSLALLALRFDPKVLKVNAISAGSLINAQASSATFGQSIRCHGRHLSGFDFCFE
jgi:hypothetical protein